MGLTPEWVGAGAQVILALGALGAGYWAIYTYREAKKAEVARWQKQIFDHLFFSGKFDGVREALELDYDLGLGRKIELSIIELATQTRSDRLSDEDRKLLLELDNFLNLIEYVLYLEQDKHQISEKDRDALLGYQISLVVDKKRPSLRYYVSRFGYEKVAALMKASGGTLLVLYGSLRKDQPKFEELGLAKALEPRGPCRFKGDLYDLGDYPGAVAGTREVHGELYEVVDEGIFADLDEYEEIDRPGPEEPLFVRRCIQVEGFGKDGEESGEAWVYLYNGSTARRPLIASGDWLSARGPAE